MKPAQPDILRARRVLCVDDEPSLRELLHVYLSREGYEVETAPDGLTAWWIISANPSRFDAVITDNQMPIMTGLQLVEQLRQHEFPGRVLMFSSTVAQENPARLHALGLDAVVEKGEPISKLLAALRCVLS